MVGVNEKEVIKVSPHFLCGTHDGINVKIVPAGESRKNAGEHIRLNLPGNIQLGADPFLFSGDSGQIGNIALDLFLHPVDGAGQKTDFILIPDNRRQLLTGGNIFAGKAGGLVTDLTDRLKKDKEASPAR